MTPTSRHSINRPRLSQVKIDDSFWNDRIETVRTTTLPFQLAQFDRVGHFEALALDWTREDETPHIFWDSDVAKWIEAASYQLEIHYDSALDKTVDEVVGKVAAAQQPDGYLNSYFMNVAPKDRFTDLRDAHELYCAGHLIEAAVAHFEATGKRTLLNVACRYADLIAATFGRGEGQIRGYDGHEEIELALVKLFETTNERRYLNLARYFVDERGQEPYFFDLEAERRGTSGWFGDHFPDRDEKPLEYREYQQAHLPVRDHTDVVGHAVRAVYLYSAVTDLAAIDSDVDLVNTVVRLWNHVTTKRMYVTGGIGSSAHNEGFTSDYDLPDFDAYSETCAAIGLMMWSTRMLDLDTDGRYGDVLERALYNNVLAGANHDGTCFFYDNPLASRGDKARSEWFGVACCPPNLARLLSSLGRYIYAQTDSGIRVDLHIGSTLETVIGGRGVVLTQATEMPDGGATRYEVQVDAPDGLSFEISIRIPGWSSASHVEVNGSAVDIASSTTKGFLRLNRAWMTGDHITVSFDLTPRRVWARPEVESAFGRVSLARGPFVYCFETADNDVPLHQVTLPRGEDIRTTKTHVGAGTALEIRGLVAYAAPNHSLYSSIPSTSGTQALHAIPYFDWGNRDQGQMRVWIPETPGEK